MATVNPYPSNLNSFQKKFIGVFLLFACFRWFQQDWLYQIHSNFVHTSFNFTQWIVIELGLVKWIANQPYAAFCLDLLHVAIPAFLLLLTGCNRSAKTFLWYSMGVYNCIYFTILSTYSVHSPEVFIAWMLFPFALMFQNHLEDSLKLLRHFFIFIIVSSAIWKIVQGGLFDVTHMSKVLMHQHKELLVNPSAHLYKTFIEWLIQHPSISKWFYYAAFFIQISFAFGWLSYRWDKIFAIAYILFLIADVFLMNINYFETSPFLLLLLHNWNYKNTKSYQHQH